MYTVYNEARNSEVHYLFEITGNAVFLWQSSASERPSRRRFQFVVTHKALRLTLTLDEYIHLLFALLSWIKHQVSQCFKEQMENCSRPVLTQQQIILQFPTEQSENYIKAQLLRTIVEFNKTIILRY